MPGKTEIPDIFSIAVEYVSLRELAEKTGLGPNELRKRLANGGIRAKVIGEDGNRETVYETTPQFNGIFPELYGEKKEAVKPQKIIPEVKEAPLVPVQEKEISPRIEQPKHLKEAPDKPFISYMQAKGYVAKQVDSLGLPSQKSDVFARIILNDISASVESKGDGVAKKFNRTELEGRVCELIECMKNGLSPRTTIPKGIYDPKNPEANGKLACYGISYPDFFRDKNEAMKFIVELLNRKELIEDQDSMESILGQSFNKNEKAYSRVRIELNLTRYLRGKFSSAPVRRGRQARMAVEGGEVPFDEDEVPDLGEEDDPVLAELIRKSTN